MNSLMISAAESRRRFAKPTTPFLGEVPASEFITGDALASAIGLTVGISQYSDEPWLVFKDPVDGKTKYVSKKPLRHTLGWMYIDAVGAAYGTKQIVIGGKTYKVRLFKCLPDGVNSARNTGGYDALETHGSEWNRLMYHITAKPFKHPANTFSSENIDEGDWASYSETDLGLNSSDTAGSNCFCQESDSYWVNNRFTRGGYGASSQGAVAFNYAGHKNFGWRPLLELVS